MKSFSEKTKETLKLAVLLFLFFSSFLIVSYFSTVIFAWVGPPRHPTAGNFDTQGSCETVYGVSVDYDVQANTIYDDWRYYFDFDWTREGISQWGLASSIPEIWKDLRTGLYWTASLGDYSNNFTIATCDFYSVARGLYTGGDVDCGDAINACAALNGTSYGGKTGWYLPNQHEFMQAYLNGAYLQTNHQFGNRYTHWTSTEASNSASNAFAANLANGGFGNAWLKTDTVPIRCVSRDTTPSPPPQVGDTYGGGIIGYLDGSGGGLIAATVDSDGGSGIQWGCYGTLLGVSGTAIGTGASNTAAILAGCATRPIAASVCDTYDGGGHNDWFLPSKDELNALFCHIGSNGTGSFWNNASHANCTQYPDFSSTLDANGNIGNFAAQWYWSSSEYDTSFAWVQDFGDGFQYYLDKNYASSVRCIRAI